MQDGMRENKEDFTSGDFFIVTGSYNDMQQFRKATLLSGISTQVFCDKITATSVISAYPPFMQVGSWTGTAGGSDWVVFGEKYTDIPKVFLTPAKGFVTTSMIVAGSFMASGTASVNVQWLAAGQY